ncbi:MAG: 2-hydroxyacyl-CoA dehydratase, partial [Proteobacteria bacterium]|nr:2-hydroxyacyl-CoA dehydratase [Pseudomonadota bacterium]
MSIQAMQKVWNEANCSGGDLLIMLCLADHVGSDREMVAWPSIGLIARRCRMTERGAQKAIRRLEAKGLINIEEGGGRGGTNRYRLTINAEPEGRISGDKNHEPEDRVSEHENPEPAFGDEQSSAVNSETQNPELCDIKPRTPVHPNLREPLEPTPLNPPKGNARASRKIRPISSKRAELQEAFDRFWVIYPRRVAKKAALEKFIRVVQRGEATAGQLVTGAERFATQMRREGRPPDKICHPTTWLHQGRWEDEGAVDLDDSRVLGTALHSLFEHDEFRAQLDGHLDDMCKRLGTTFSESKLREVVEESNRANKLWQQCLELSKRVPVPWSNTDAFAAMAPIVIARGLPQATAYYEELHAELTQRLAGLVPPELPEHGHTPRLGQLAGQIAVLKKCAQLHRDHPEQ